MAESNNKIKKTEGNKKKIKRPEKIVAYNPQFEKLVRDGKRQEEREKRRKANPKRYMGAKATLLAAIQLFALVNGIAEGTVQGMIKDIFGHKEKYTVASTVSRGESAPRIEADGRSYEIDESAYVLVKEEIKNLEEGTTYSYDAMAYDIEGNFVEGEIDGNYLEAEWEITESEAQRYTVIYKANQSIMQDGVYVVEGDNVLGTEAITSANGERVIQIIGTNENGAFRTEIPEGMLEVAAEIPTPEDEQTLYGKSAIEEGLTPMRVNTTEDNGAKLNLRTVPDEHKMYIMTQIPNGSTVYATGETTTENGRDWTEVKYINKDGDKFQGWVATEYLVELDVQQEGQTYEQLVQTSNYQESTYSSIIRNASGNVTGIDVSYMTPDELRTLLQSGISQSVTKGNREIDTSQVAGQIQFVYIKLGASPYGDGEFKPLDCNSYEGLVEVCEEFGVPYGFYYYSTSITKAEADAEKNCIKGRIEALRKKYNGLENNIMDFAIDIELVGENDRQYGKNVTDAKEYLARGLKEEGISQGVIYYGPGRIWDENSSDKIMDIPTETTRLWLCAPINNNGEQTQKTEYYYDLLENQYGLEIVNQQVVLDAEQKDIDNMKYSYFAEIQQRRGRETGTTSGVELYDYEDDYEI